MSSSRFPVVRIPDQPYLSRIQDNVANFISAPIQALNATPIMGAAPPPWILPQLLNGFTFLYTGAQQRGTGYAKDALGYVWVNVTAKNSSGSGIAGGTPIFVFPVGYRPASPLGFAVNAHTGCDPVEVALDGTVSDVNNLPNGSHVHLCFAFLAEA